MGFLDMGIGEILMVIVIALLIWGPDKVPEIARKVGKAIGTLRKASFDMTAEIRKELERGEAESQSERRIDGGMKGKESPAGDTSGGDTARQTKTEERQDSPDE